MNPNLSAALRSIIPAPAPRPPVEETQPTPDVDDDGAGETPITPPLKPGAVQPAPPADGPLPAVEVEAVTLSGATKMVRLGPVARTTAMTSYTLINAGQPVRIAAGSSTPRRVTVYVASDPGAGLVYLAQDARQDSTGLPLTSSVGPIELHGGDDFYAYWPFNGSPGASPVIGVIIEPLTD
jgi:hypothetical protein